MKRFIVSVLCVSVFFIGLGTLIEKVSATFKSDEKALELIGKARQAIGGDSAISGVKSMTILGKATKTFEVEGVAKTENGETEINFELPNKMSQQVAVVAPADCGAIEAEAAGVHAAGGEGGEGAGGRWPGR